MQDSPDAQFIIIANALPEVNGQTTEKKRAQEKKTGNFSSHHRGGHRRHGLSKCDEGVQLGRYIYSNFQNSSHP